MKCYNFKCQEECNSFKSMYCFKKVTKEQYKAITSLKGNHICNKCGRETVAARHYTNKHYRKVQLCTNCSNEKAI